MNASKSFLLFFIFFIVFSCSNDQKSNDAKLYQTIEGLEKNVEKLHAELEDQKLKTRISFMVIRSNPIFNTPMEDFFLASDDFFNGTVDVGLLNCQKNCANIVDTCKDIRDVEKRTQCYEELAQRRNKCVQNCQKEFPITEKMPEPDR